MAHPKICPECHKHFNAERAEQVHCSNHCARIVQARHGVPSYEDKKMLLADRIIAAIDAVFKPKDK